MRRRDVVVVLASLALAHFPAPVAGQQAHELPRVAIIFPGDAATATPYRDAFSAAMADLGHVEGRNATFDIRYRGTDVERIPSIIDELLRAKPAVIVMSGSETIQAAQKATRIVPIVFSTAGDPVASGFVQSLAHPGGNITGVTLLTSELNAKRLELIKEAMPGAERIAIVQNSKNPATGLMLRDIEATTRSLKLAVRAFDVHGAQDIAGAFDSIVAWHADAVLILDDAQLVVHAAEIAAEAASRHLPLGCPITPRAKTSCVISYGVDLPTNWRRAAGLVHKILTGSRPGDLPVENPTGFKFIANLLVASDLGLTIPTSVLLRADEVIE